MTAHVALRERSPIETNRLGLWLFFYSESFLFAAFIAARFFLVGISDSGEVDQPLGALMTVLLLLSSVTAFRARRAIAQGRRQDFVRALALTGLLGIVFLIGVGIEWATAGFSKDDAWGTAFFSLTGLHAGHVLSGVVALGLVAWLGARGHFSRESYWGVEATTKYWTFIDVVWIFVYVSLYLLRG
jgi:cytochrome c oxidase subunit III